MSYLSNAPLIKARILKILLHMCDTYNYDYLKYSTFRFNFIIFKNIVIFQVFLQLFRPTASSL